VVTATPPSRVELAFALLALMLKPLLWLAERALKRADARAAARALGAAEAKLAHTLREALIALGYQSAADLPDAFLLSGLFEIDPGSDQFIPRFKPRRLWRGAALHVAIMRTSGTRTRRFDQTRRAANARAPPPHE
jgi:hypothetical protein